MAKILYPYNGLTAAQIAAKASNTCTLTVSGSQVNCNDVTTAKIKSVLGSSSNAVSALCSSSAVNKYSGFSPYEYYNSGSVLASRLKQPYTMGSFCGYNHNAVTPYSTVNADALLESSYALQNYNLTIGIQLGEVNYSSTGFSDYLITVDGVIVSTGLLSSLNGDLISVVTPVTLPNQGETRTYNVQVWLGISDIHVNTQFTMLAKSTSFTVKVAPVFANHLINDSAANREVVDYSYIYDNSTYYCNRIDVVSSNKSISVVGNTLSGKYICTADIKYISNGAYYTTIEFPHREFRCSVYMYKINSYSMTQSSDYLIQSSAFIENISGGVDFTYTIPAGLAPVSGDMFYIKFDNLI